MIWGVINPRCQRKVVHIKKVVGAHGNHQVYLSLISKSQQVCEEGSLQVAKMEHVFQKSHRSGIQSVPMTIKRSIWNRVRFPLKNQSGWTANKFSMKKSAPYVRSCEEKFINEVCTCHDGKQSSGRYKDAVRTDQDRIFYFKCLFIKNDGENLAPKSNQGENMAPKSNPGEKEETSADTVFFMKKICSGSNKYIVSNQQVLKTPAREGDKPDLTNDEVGIRVEACFRDKAEFFHWIVTRFQIDKTCDIHYNEFEKEFSVSNDLTRDFTTVKMIHVNIATISRKLTMTVLNEVDIVETMLKESSGKLWKVLIKKVFKESSGKLLKVLNEKVNVRFRGYADIGLAGIFRKHIWKDLRNHLSKEMSDEQVYGYFKNEDRSKFKYQEALFDIIVGKFVNRQSDTTNFEMNHQVYCCVKIGS